VLFLVVLSTFVRFVVPSVAAEANRMIDNLPELEQRLIETKNRVVQRYPTMREPINGFMRSALSDAGQISVDRQLASERIRLGLTEEEVAAAVAAGGSSAAPQDGPLGEYFTRRDRVHLAALVNEQFARVRDYAPTVINTLYRGTATMLLALFFSFLILIDLQRIKRGIGRLQVSRIGDFYKEAAHPVVRFGSLVGKAFEAQALIACVNTVLTLVGLLLLGVPMIAMLSVIVFACSFIPVLGVFISTTPIVLVALNDGGPSLALAALGLIVVIHAIEAYFLNPIIYGRHLNLNPVLTLIILYVGYHLFGLWGMLLGVPVSRYFIHDVLGVPFRDRREPRQAPNHGRRNTA
jgi:predicted PurR-regulated permease PerM